MKSSVLNIPIMCLALALGFLNCGSNSTPSNQTREDDKISTQSDAGTPSTISTKIQFGIDVSHFSGTIDWGQVKQAGKYFGYAKATEGITYTDPAFATNWANMKAAKILRGAYHFYVVDDDPEAQAKHFIKTVTLEAGDLPPVVDVETAGKYQGEELAKRLKVFLKIIEEHYDMIPMVYTDSGFWNGQVDTSVGNYPLWLAQTGVSQPTLPTGWQQWTIWQYSFDQTVPGVEKSADLDQFSGSLAELKALTKKPKQP